MVMQTLLLCAIEIVSVQCSVHQSCKRCLTMFDDNLPIHDVNWCSMHYPGYLFGALLHGFKSRPHYHSHYPAYGRYGPYGYHGHAASVVRWGCGKIICRLYNHNLGYIQFEQLPGEQFQKQGMMTFSCKWSLVIFTWKPLNSFTWNINLDIFIWIDNYCSYTLYKDGNKEILFKISVLLSNNIYIFPRSCTLWITIENSQEDDL